MSLTYKDDLLKALQQEMILAHDFIKDKNIQTIYFGGGTPSLLSIDEINRLVHKLSEVYNVHQVTEWTLEANPDDLSTSYLKDLKKYTPINRLSIGIQSFQAHDLLLMNRAHNVQQALYCIPAAQDIGFENLSCDLIFGTPTLSHTELGQNIQTLLQHQVPHISAYALSIEEQTPLYKKIKKGEIIPGTDTHYEEQMRIMMETLQAHHYLHYEISNYALEGHLAVHNTNYWKQVPYWGFGPSAHAYNGEIRRWNVRNNQQYIRSILLDNKIPFEQEILTTKDTINETIMTSLRTMWGLSLDRHEQTFGNEEKMRVLTSAHRYIEEGQLIISDKNTLQLVGSAKIISDAIIADLFI